MYRVWHSAEGFADFVIDKTILSSRNVVKKPIAESDAAKPKDFYKIPDHIRKILYLDCADLIIEKDNNPIICIEETKEAGTGHNVTQRFSRIMAALENQVPVIYIQPEGTIISRKTKKKDKNGNTIMSIKWDKINPFLFAAMERATNLYQIPALFYYFPTDIRSYESKARQAPHFKDKGIQYDSNIVNYPACPNSKDPNIKNMLSLINEIIGLVEKYGVADFKNHLMGNRLIQNQRLFMNSEFSKKANGADPRSMSPASNAIEVPTEYLLNYLSKYENKTYTIGELLKQREKSVIYQADSKEFRGDPYAGNLSAIDCFLCRNGKTFEDRDRNLVLAFGTVTVDRKKKTISINNRDNLSIGSFFSDVINCNKNNLLTKKYGELKSSQIPRYFMQVRYGSTYSKNKHIRVYSHLSDAILFEDGSLWRDA